MRNRSGTRSRSQAGSKKRDRALDSGRGHAVALNGELVAQLGHALLELVVALVEFGQALGVVALRGASLPPMALPHAVAFVGGTVGYGHFLCNSLLIL
jgi:hypothetical protein